MVNAFGEGRDDLGHVMELLDCRCAPDKVPLHTDFVRILQQLSSLLAFTQLDLTIQDNAIKDGLLLEWHSSSFQMLSWHKLHL